MTAFFIYLLKVIACSALFAGCYWWALRNGRFYQWNRFCIVASVALSIVIPALNIPLPSPHIAIPSASEYVAHIVVEPNEAAAVSIQPQTSSIPWVWLGWMSCMFITFFLLVKEIVSFIRILRLKRRSERIRIPETVLYCTDDAAAPFSFFRTIFWKKDFSVDSSEGRHMLLHEMAHVRLGHSWDKALMQLVCCLFWMNPFFMLFRRELELVHEFAADSESLGENNAEELSSLILCTLYPKHYHDFISRFFQSPIKRRIIMITKNKKSSMNMLRKMSIVPVALVAFYLFACNNDSRRGSVTEIAQPLSESLWQDSWKPMNDMEEPIIISGYLKEEVTQKQDVMVTHDSERKVARKVIPYTDVEQKPVFQGTDNDFRQYLTKNLTYPADAQTNGIAGTIVVSFVVDKEGEVTDVKSPVKIEYLSDELEKAVQSSPAWKPGNQGGKAVSVQCYTFVEFKLRAPLVETNGEAAYIFVEEMPEFPGGAEEFRKFVQNALIYPQTAIENGIKGMVIVNFVVETDGSISDAKVLRGLDPACDAEALRVIKSTPKWKPGKQKGQIVRVQYSLPIRYDLSGGTSSAPTSSEKKEQAGTKTQTEDEEIFQFVEEMPEFPGGEEAFRKLVANNLIYPPTAIEKGIKGMVTVNFVVEKDGSISNAKILRSLDRECDAEALRVIKSMPKWKPGKQKGQVVRVNFSLPIKYDLTNN